VASGGIIVLAEDDERMRRLYCDALGIAGFSVLAAADGVEALGYLSKATPRLVILDIMMPNLNGIETCKRARKIIGDDIPIIFLSAMDQIDILRDCVAAGGDDYMIKSHSLFSLVERIKLWTRHAQRQGLVARREKLLKDLSTEIASSTTDFAKEALPSPSVEEDSDIAGLLVLVKEALQNAGARFGKAPEHKQYLAGYIAGIIESWSGAGNATKEIFSAHYQVILEATGLFTLADATRMTVAYDDLSKDADFIKGKVRGQEDATQRRARGPDYTMTGLADSGAAVAS